MWTSKPKTSLAETLSRQCSDRMTWLKSQGLFVWRESDERHCTVTVSGRYGTQLLTHSETLAIIGRSDVELHSRCLWSMDYAAGVVLALREQLKKRT